MEKLIITCCPNETQSWKHLDGLQHIPMTTREVADAVRSVRDAGAAVVHVHEPLTRGMEDLLGYNVEAWIELAQLIRQESDVIFEHGQGGTPYFDIEQRMPDIPLELRQRTFDLGVEKPDLIATLLTEVDHDFGLGYHLMPTRDEVAKWMHLCRESGVKPAFEAWHVGAYCELQWLVDKGLVDPPYWFTLFFGATSGVGSPPTIEELLYRIKYLPEHSLWQVSVFCSLKGSATIQQQLALFTHAIALGGHVRLGMEDCPYYWDGVPAESNAQLVERVVRIARELGREVATPAEARQMLGLTP